MAHKAVAVMVGLPLIHLWPCSRQLAEFLRVLDSHYRVVFSAVQKSAVHHDFEDQLPSSVLPKLYSDQQSSNTMAQPQQSPQVINEDPIIKSRLCLDWTPQQTQNYLESITVYVRKRIPDDQVLPARNIYMAEDSEIKDGWDNLWRGVVPADLPRDKKGEPKGPIPESKWPHREIQVIERDNFHVIPLGEERIIRDAEPPHELVYVKQCNAIRDPDIFAGIDRVCKLAARERRSIRRDDPGKMGDIGFTAGARKIKGTSSALAKGLWDEEKLSNPQKARIHLEEAGMASIVWNVMKARMPPEIIEDFNKAIEKKGLMRMTGPIFEQISSLFSPDGKKEHRFQFEEAAPPRGACAMNYSRFCHNEKGGNEWLVALGTCCSADPKDGGNFFLAQYGVLSLAEANTFTAWRCKDLHGTTLYRLQDRQCCGVALMVPSRLIAASKLLEKEPGKDEDESKDGVDDEDEVDRDGYNQGKKPRRAPRPPMPTYSHADLLKVERRTWKGRSAGNMKRAENVNRLAVRDTTPEQPDLTEMAMHVTQNGDSIGADGSTELERMVLTNVAIELADRYEEAASRKHGRGHSTDDDCEVEDEDSGTIVVSRKRCRQV